MIKSNKIGMLAEESKALPKDHARAAFGKGPNRNAVKHPLG
jgi:hypothetical protein